MSSSALSVKSLKVSPSSTFTVPEYIMSLISAVPPPILINTLTSTRAAWLSSTLIVLIGSPSSSKTVSPVIFLNEIIKSSSRIVIVRSAFTGSTLPADILSIFATISSLSSISVSLIEFSVIKPCDSPTGIVIVLLVTE